MFIQYITILVFLFFFFLILPAKAKSENKRDAGADFADFCDDLALNFPRQNLQNIKFCIKGRFS